jgi:hypothetical protein
MKPRLLLITYYFPPCGGAAVQRWLRWLPELVKAGYGVDVLTISDGDFPFRDDSLLAKIPAEVKVHRTPAPRMGKLWKLMFGKGSSLPYGSLSPHKDDPLLKRFLVWVRINLIIPDMRVFWNRRAYKTARDLLLTAPYDLVITTGPPHSTHLIGLKLKAKYQVRWFADWRDPWTGIYYLKLNPPLRISMRRQKALERKVAESADLNICVSHFLAGEIPGERKMVLYNGFDALGMPPRISRHKDGILRIKYAGQITEGQDISLLVEVLAAAVRTIEVELSFIGTTLSKPLQRDLRAIPKLKLRLLPFIPHADALREIVDADLLVLLINNYDGYEGMLTTKLFEYLGSGNPVLGLGPHGGEAEELILSHNSGKLFSGDETEDAVAWMLAFYNGDQNDDESPQNINMNSLSAQHQALKLIDAIHQ